MQGFFASTKTTAYKKNVKENNLFQIKKFFCKLFLLYFAFQIFLKW